MLPVVLIYPAELDFPLCQLQSHWGRQHEVPKTVAADQVASIYLEQ